MKTTRRGLLTLKQVRGDLANLADYRRFARSPLTWYSILCPLCGIEIEGWRRLPEEGRWVALRDGLAQLLAEKVTGERDPQRAAVYGYVWVRYFCAGSAAHARTLLSREKAIQEALVALATGGKNHLRRWCGRCIFCLRTSPAASTTAGRTARWPS